MKPATQATSKRCDCGELMPVTPTASLWDFDWSCGCGRRGSIAWNSDKPPPRYTPIVTQADLFREGQG